MKRILLTLTTIAFLGLAPLGCTAESNDTSKPDEAKPTPTTATDTTTDTDSTSTDAAPNRNTGAPLSTDG